MFNKAVFFSLFLGIILGCGTSGWCGESDEILVGNIRYTYDKNPDNDRDNTRLVDGVDAMVGPWHHARNMDVTLDLRQVYDVTRVEADICRGNLKWVLKGMSLFADIEGEMQLFGTLKTEMESDKFSSELTFGFNDVGKSTQRLRVRFYANGHYFAVSEIRVYAKKPPKITKVELSEEDAGVLTPYAFPESSDKLVLSKGNFDRDPGEELYVGNKFFQMMIEPQDGGVIGGFRYHGLDMTQPQNPAALGGGGGFFADIVNSTGGRGDWWHMPYTYKIIEQSPEQISIQMSRTGFTGSFMFLTINKTYTVWRDRSYVRVDYDMELAKEATTSLPFRFLFHNYVGTRNGLAQSEDNDILIPEQSGLTRYNFNKPDASDQAYKPDASYQAYWYNPSRGWTGFVDTARKIGFTFGMDYRYMDYFYCWGSTNHEGLPTLEWRFNEVSIKDGESFKTTMYVMPFEGFTDVAGGGGYVVGGMTCTEEKVSLNFVSGRDQEGEAVLRYRILPGPKWHEVARKQVSLAVDEPLAWDVDFKAEEEGTYIVSLLLMDGETELLEMEKPLVVGSSSGPYVMRPRQDRIIEESSIIKTDYTSMEFETPHVKWGKPYHGGKTKALILMDGKYQREVIEVAQRMDLEFDTTYLYQGDMGAAIVDYYGRTSGGDLKAGLERLLRENPEWEVMVMAGHMFKYFDPDQIAAVLKRVEEGAGLVIVQPEPMFVIEQVSPLQKSEDGGFLRAGWQKQREHFITTGVPFEELPATDGYAYDVTSDGEVLATMGGKPLVAVRKHGKGRVVAMAYRSADRGKRKTFFGLTPFMTREKESESLAPKPPYFAYHEYYFSLLGKAMLWAAGNEPDVVIEKITADDKEIKLEINNSGEAITVKLDTRIQDKYGDRLAQIEEERRIVSGKQVLTVKMPKNLRQGLNLADVFVRDDLGKVINWGTVAVNVEQPVRIASVTGFEKVYLPGDAVTVDVKLVGEDQKGMSVTVSLWDGFGRQTASLSKPMSVSSEKKFSLKLEGAINRFLAIEVDLKVGDRSIDLYRVNRPLELGYKAVAKSGDPVFFGWNLVSMYGLNNYLHDGYLDVLEDIGFNAGMVMYGDKVPSYEESLWRHNMPIQERSGGIGTGFAQEGSDPEHPTRRSCPNDPKVRKGWSQRVSGTVSGPNVYSFQFGDEALFAHTGCDICFCEHCMARMQAWLKGNYSDLGELNKVWGTSFDSWKKVRPLTLKETQGRGGENYASWSDHRRFNEFTMTEFYGLINKAVKAKKPWGRFGVSGDFGPGAYSGQDIWRWRKCFSHIEAYNAFDELDAWRDEEGSEDIEIRKYGNWGGRDATRESIFHYMFYGVNGMAICGTHRLPNFDWSLSGVAKGYKDGWEPIARGLGRIMMESRHARGGLAMHYSRNDSARTAMMRGVEVMWKNMRWEIREMTIGAGFDHDVISYEQIENGVPSKTRVIMLPMSMSITKKEKASLESFVRDGGVLLGIMGIGVADGNCSPLAKGALDDVFGIVRDNSKIVKRPGPVERVKEWEGLAFPEIMVDHVETGLAAGSASVLARTKEGNVPIAFANRYGLGAAVYLACNLPIAYSEIGAARSVGDNGEVMDEVEQFLVGLFAKGGVEPVLKITDSQGKHPPYLRVVKYQDGPVSHFGIMREHRFASNHSREPIQVKIEFPAQGYIREFLTERDLGLTDTTMTLLTPTTVQFYTVLPYEVEAVELKLPKANFGRGELLTYSIAIKAEGQLGNHILRMNVLDPDGNEYEPYSINITSQGGKYAGEIPLALNEKKGVWTIEVTDLYSGKKTTSKFEVK